MVRRGWRDCWAEGIILFVSHPWGMLEVMNTKFLISITLACLAAFAVTAQKTGNVPKAKAVADPVMPILTNQSMAWESFTNWTTIGRVIPLSSPNTPLTAVVLESPRVAQVSTVTSNLYLDFSYRAQNYRILMESFNVTNHVPETRVIEGN